MGLSVIKLCSSTSDYVPSLVCFRPSYESKMLIFWIRWLHGTLNEGYLNPVDHELARNICVTYYLSRFSGMCQSLAGDDCANVYLGSDLHWSWPNSISEPGSHEV